KLWTVLREGISRAQLARDALSGLIVGIVALPLAIAFAIASGVAPERGLATAVVAGFLISALGGSRVAIGGPTGAFVVIVFGVVEEHGVDGLLLATSMAGVILLLFGLFRMGQVIKFIPYPVTTGFTAGIGAIIFLSQLREVLGLPEDLPAETVPRVAALVARAGDANPWAIAVAVGTVVTIVGLRKALPRVPGPVVALVLFTAASSILSLPVESVGDRFGALPQGLPAPAVPEVSLARLGELLPAALTIALLAAIESLLCCVVADGMIDDKHDSNQELVAQGVANLVAPIFGGFAATGAIARTATNVQNGASSPVAGIVHAIVVLGFVTLLAATAEEIPLSVLAGILVVVAWNMSEVPRLKRILRMPRSDAAVLAATFGITVFVDLVTAVEVGMVLAAFLFMLRMSKVARVEVIDPQADMHYARQQSLAGKDIPPGVVVYSIDGPFFFGAAEEFQATLERVAGAPKVLILRMRHVPYIDATGLHAFEHVVKAFRSRGTTVILSAVQTQPLEAMMLSGFLRHVGDANVRPNIDAALARARDVLAATRASPATGG
ncbi:MAG: SulP family inorganic anion transporter, partial [Methanobacteriota archaeon]